MFLIKKKIIRQEKVSYVLLTNGHSEILEINDEVEANNLCDLMNENSDEFSSYAVIGIK
jgi:hypothetical protein